MTRAVLAVALNTAIDKTVTVTDFTVGQSYTAETLRAVPGGKGINVARVLTSLGCRVRVLGFAGGPMGEAIRRGLEAEDLSFSLTNINEDSRTCWAVIDPVHHTATEVNEPGPVVRAAEMADFMTTYRLLVRGAGLVAISGSLPRGIPASFYADLIGEAWEQGVPCTLDTRHTEAFTLGLAAGPLLIKPNARELAALTGHEITTVEEADDAARSLLDQGALLVAVSLGAGGAVLRGPQGGWYAAAPTITPVNTVGSGDAFMAGFIAHLMKSLPDRPAGITWEDDDEPQGGFLALARDEAILREALRLATATGTANTLMPGAGQVRSADVARLLPQIHLVDLAP